MDSVNIAFLTLCFGTIGALIVLYRLVTFWARKGIPHLTCVPIFGSNYPLIFRRIAISDYVTHIYNLFPDARYFGAMDFHNPVAFVRDPELIKEICVKNFDSFLDHKSFFDESMDPLFGKNVFSLRGERWRKMRNTLSPSFTATKMKFMFELIEKCSRDFVQHFLDHPDETNSVETKDAFTRYTNDVIATAAFGISVNSMQNRDNEFYVRGKDASTFGTFWRFIKFAICRISPKIMRLIGEPFISRVSARFFKTIIRETLKTREEKNIIRPDMIHLLMEARDKDGAKLSVDDIIAQAFIFFLAGFDTTSTSMCFIAHELAMNPEVQEKLRNEVDTITKNEGSEISYDTLSKMKYMDMVISEGLRKYPTSPMTDRLCVKQYTLPKPTPDSREYTAEPNSAIWIPIQALHHDPKYFPDPEKFDPERFNDQNKDKINPYAYLPFGLGPRKCIGNRFALMEIKLLFVHVLQNFILEPSVKTKHPLEFAINITVAIKGGTWVKLTKRA